MKTNMLRIRVFTVAMTCLFLGAIPAFAHYPWLNVTDYTPASGRSVSMTIGWGHRYPLAGFLKKDAVEKIAISGPEKAVLNFVSEIEIKSDTRIHTEGAYIVSVSRKPSFYTKTTQGNKRLPKKGLEHVIKCSFSHMCMKAIVNVGHGKGKVDAIVGHPMEIVPLENPANLRSGDFFPVQVLWHGKPFKGYIYATFAGFSTESETFAYTTKTDKKGKGKIKILQPGVWMIKAAGEQAHPDPEQCDVDAFVATLTFEVK